MGDFVTQFQNLRDLPSGDKLISVVDILLVAYVIYRLLMLVRGARTWRIIAGILGFVFVYLLSGKLGLATLNWLLEKATYLAPVALVILFLPELRAAVEIFGGRPSQMIQKLVQGGHAEDRAEAHTVEEIVSAVAELASGSIGAIIVVEKTASLDETISNGVYLHARVSTPLLVSIFFENNPLHDGAVIIRGDQIMAASCRLPVSESPSLDQSVHLRHRAAVGITELFDCLSIVVSEERGTIGIASEGKLRRLASHVELRTILNKELRNIDETTPSVRRHPEKRRRQGVGK